jgi:hypothetical protein
VKIGDIEVKRHDIHGYHVSNMSGNTLYAAYTLVWRKGEDGKESIESGAAIGPKEAKLSDKGKNGHTERQVGEEIIQKIEVAVTRPVDDELIAIIIEIHQTYTPCSGEQGCAKYLEDKIMKVIAEATEVPTLILRASATMLYPSGWVKTHPLSDQLDSKKVHHDWSTHSLEGQTVVVHNLVK